MRNKSFLVFSTPCRQRKHSARSWLQWFCAAGVALAFALPAWALDTFAVYEKKPAAPDGIGKVYMGREIAQVMGFSGAAWLERDQREREERTDLLLPQLNLRPGMVVADIGAGTGYYTRRIAPRLAPGGRVIAVDVQSEMVSELARLSKRDGLTNIFPVLGSVTDVRIAPATLDLSIMIDVYHELEYPVEVLASIVRATKPGGRVAFVEYRAEDAKVPIKTLHKMSEAQVRKEAAAQGLVWDKTLNMLPWQHVVVFHKPGQN